MKPSEDLRSGEYTNLLTVQLKNERELNLYSAERILSIVWRYFQPQSVLDIGCGIGTWLNVCSKLGVETIRGVDGPWTPDSVLEIPVDLIQRIDFEDPSACQPVGRFDLAICLEVAEHLSASAAKHFVNYITASADVVLFSAAIPAQGGTHHLNEQWPSYWAGIFASCGFVPLDFIRSEIWMDNRILWWLRQNTIMYISKKIVDERSELKPLLSIADSLSIVHPSVYASKVRYIRTLQAELQAVKALLAEGGFFKATKTADGDIQLEKISSTN